MVAAIAALAAAGPPVGAPRFDAPLVVASVVSEVGLTTSIYLLLDEPLPVALLHVPVIGTYHLPT